MPPELVIAGALFGALLLIEAAEGLGRALGRLIWSRRRR